MRYAGNWKAVISSSLDQPYGLTLFDRFVYWTDWGNKSVIRADKYNGTRVELLKTGVNVLRDLSVFAPQRQPPGGPCTSNGGCKELCLAVSASERRSEQMFPAHLKGLLHGHFVDFWSKLS